MPRILLANCRRVSPTVLKPTLSASHLFYFYLRPRTRHTLGAGKFDDAAASHLGCRQSRDFHEQKISPAKKSVPLPKARLARYARFGRQSHSVRGGDLSCTDALRFLERQTQTRQDLPNGYRKQPITAKEVQLPEPCNGRRRSRGPAKRSDCLQTSRQRSEVKRLDLKLCHIFIYRWRRCQFAFRLGRSQRRGSR